MANVAERLVGLMRGVGVRHVFGVPSGSWTWYMEAMRTGGVEFVLVINEAAAGFMADTCARLTGVPGVCYGTVGPGATNLSTGVGGALLDRSPLIALTSEPPEPMIGRTVQMAIDQQALFRPLTKWTTRMSADRVEETFAEALRVALSEPPGPVHIGLPEDLGSKPAVPRHPGVAVPGAADGAAEPRETRSVSSPADEASLAAMERAFGGARRPVLAVGLTAVRAGAGALVARLAERHRMPVILTPMAKGLLPEGHPWYAGVLFHALSDRVAEVHRQADLVVGVGYDPVEFNYEEWLPQVPLLHLDPLPADIDRSAYRQVIDVRGALRPSLERLAAAPPLQSAWDEAELAAWRRRLFAELAPPPGSFGPRAALAILREVLPLAGILTCDVGAHTHLIGQMWPTPGPGLQLMTNGWSSMGFGVPSAIAAKLCRPDTPVACVTGDGGFLMMAGEMTTARRLGLPVVFVLLSDLRLELIRIKQERKGFARYGTVLYGENAVHGEDYEPSPSLFGVPVLPARDAASYRAALREAFRSAGPVIVEAFIDGAEYDGLILRKHK